LWTTPSIKLSLNLLIPCIWRGWTGWGIASHFLVQLDLGCKIIENLAVVLLLSNPDLKCLLLLRIWSWSLSDDSWSRISSHAVVIFFPFLTLIFYSNRFQCTMKDARICDSKKDFGHIVKLCSGFQTRHNSVDTTSEKQFFKKFELRLHNTPSSKWFKKSISYVQVTLFWPPAKNSIIGFEKRVTIASIRLSNSFSKKFWITAYTTRKALLSSRY
jgi:hypothetical protein